MLVTNMHNNNPNNINQNNFNFNNNNNDNNNHFKNEINAAWCNNMITATIANNMQQMQHQQQQLLLQPQQQLLARMTDTPREMRADMNNNQNVIVQQQQQHLQQQQQQQQQYRSSRQSGLRPGTDPEILAKDCQPLLDYGTGSCSSQSLQQQQQQQQQYYAPQYQNFQQQQQQKSAIANNCNSNQMPTNTLPSMNYYNTSARNMQHLHQQHQLQQQQQHQQQMQQLNRSYCIATPTPTPTATPTPQQQQQHQQLSQHQHQLQTQHRTNSQISPQLMQQNRAAALTPSPHQLRSPIHSAHQRLVSIDGIHSTIPTQTTSTLTPTTLKSIEDTFNQLVDEPVTVPCQAGFIPPSYPSTSINTVNIIGGTFNGSVHDINDINELNDTDSDDSRISFGQRAYEDYQLGGDTTENSSATTDSTSFQNGLNKSSLATSNSNSASTNDFTAVIAAAAGKKNNNVNTSSSATTVTPPPTRRNQGGRRPAKASNLSPEEEEKRRIRRERNKLAAARCRKRRVDLTNDLLEEVAILERKRDGLQKDIETLNTQKQELQYILEAHRPTCEKIRQDILTVNTYGGIIAPTKAHNDNSNANITGIDTTLASTGRSSPIDLKPVILNDSLLSVPQIKDEPLDTTLDSNSLDNDDVGPTSPKRMLLSNNNPMIPPPLPKIATLSPSLAAAAASASLHTPIVTTAPVSFGSFGSSQNNAMVVNTLNALNKPLLNVAKQRPTTLPTMPRNSTLGLNVDNKPPTDINGVAIQTPSTGMFNFDSLMDGGTGLTPVSGPLVPTCSSQNKHPLELVTPTSEPSKLVSL